MSSFQIRHTYYTNIEKIHQTKGTEKRKSRSKYVPNLENIQHLLSFFLTSGHRDSEAHFQNEKREKSPRRRQGQTTRKPGQLPRKNVRRRPTVRTQDQWGFQNPERKQGHSRQEVRPRRTRTKCTILVYSNVVTVFLTLSSVF